MNSSSSGYGWIGSISHCEHLLNRPNDSAGNVSLIGRQVSEAFAATKCFARKFRMTSADVVLFNLLDDHRQTVLLLRLVNLLRTFSPTS